MQPCLLNAEENRVGAIQRAQSALGQTPERFAVRFLCRGNAELQLFIAAFLEDAQDISRVAQVEPRDRFEKWQDAVDLGVVRRDGRVISRFAT